MPLSRNRPFPGISERKTSGMAECPNPEQEFITLDCEKRGHRSSIIVLFPQERLVMFTVDRKTDSNHGIFPLEWGSEG